MTALDWVLVVAIAVLGALVVAGLVLGATRKAARRSLVPRSTLAQYRPARTSSVDSPDGQALD